MKLARESRGRWEGCDLWVIQIGQCLSWLGWSKCFSSWWLHLFVTYLVSASVDLDFSVFFAKMLWEAMPNEVGGFLSSQSYHLYWITL